MVSSRSSPAPAEKEIMYSVLCNEPAKAALGMAVFRGIEISALGSRRNILCPSSLESNMLEQMSCGPAGACGAVKADKEQIEEHCHFAIQPQ